MEDSAVPISHSLHMFTETIPKPPGTPVLLPLFQKFPRPGIACASALSPSKVAQSQYLISTHGGHPHLPSIDQLSFTVISITALLSCDI